MAALLLALTACGQNDAELSETYTDNGTIALGQIQDNPVEYVGQILTLSGIVIDVARRDFTLQNAEGTFEIIVDYGGNTPFPNIGDTVAATGLLTEIPPC